MSDQKDAERYRWLRSKGFGFTHDEEERGIATSRWGNWCWDSAEGFAEQADAVIDRAMKADEQKGVV